MLIEIASLIIINTNQIKETNVDNLSLNRPRISFVAGESKFQISERERIAKENYERIRQQTIAREKAERASRGESYSGTGGYVEIIGEDTQYFNCVKYAKAKSGISRSIGNGGRAGVNSQTPQVGAIGVEKARYHAVVIEKIEGDKITVTEANYYKRKLTRRVLNRSDFIGFVI